MTVHFRQQGKSIIVFGNTYPIKDAIKALGGRFNGSEKNWIIPFSDKVLKEIAGLCGESPALNTAADDDEEEDLFAAKVQKAQQQKMETTEEGISIKQLMEKIAYSVSNAFPAPVWVVGEIQNIAKRGSGVFLELAEPQDGGHQSATTTVRAILWQSSKHYIESRRGKDKIEEVLQDGMRIRCLCQVGLYKERGSISISIEDIDPAFTKGALALEREKILKELRSKGLDKAQSKLELPPFPFHVGLITADGSRAKSDFEDQLKTRGFPGEISFEQSPMQGEAVPKKVVAAIKALIAKDVDMIVITRGGGSAADLRWFDAREIAYAIAECPIPVICAIGHHDDQSIAEDIAFQREKTPTAAAEWVLDRFEDTRRFIMELATTLANSLAVRLEEVNHLQLALSERLIAAADRTIANRNERLMGLTHNLTHFAFARLSSINQVFNQMTNKMHTAVSATLNSIHLKLGDFERELIKLDPTPWLKKGWTQLSGKNGMVSSVAQLSLEETLSARLVDGKVSLKITKIDPKN